MRIAFVVVLLLALGALSSVSARYIWPQPQTMTPGSYSELVDVSAFVITTNSSSELLSRAMERYQKQLLFPFGAGASVSSPDTLLNTLSILVGSDSEDLQLYVDESYTLQILNPSSEATITAATVYGALRGLESFSQVIDWDDATQQYSCNVLPLYVNDAPRFPWRGLLIDTSRHYLLPSTILRTVDAMSYDKLNTLHWHIIDAESFPIVSDTCPLLTEAAYAPSAIYTHDVVEQIVSYAKDRGVRVVPEFDIPGHAYSWGKGYPNITVDCPDYDSNINNVPLNPTIEETWTVLKSFLPEMAALFEDNHFHVGGDEVEYVCWNDNAQVVQWMQDNNMSDQDLLQYFEDNLAPIIKTANKTAVVWEDLFDNGITLDSSYIVEVWSEADTLQELINAGFKSISAYGYYLNEQEPLDVPLYEWVDTWQVFYGHDVMDGLTGDQATLDLVIGGEAAMWSEQVDSVNYDSRVWPRACGVSERLWSAADVTDVDDATTRLIEHRCTIARRGVGAGPISPDYCSIPYTPYSCNSQVGIDVVAH